MKNGDQPAFANETYPEFARDFKRKTFNGFGVNPTGLTKREYFAAMAMLAYATSPNSSPDKAAEFAIKCADELLKQLEAN